jgi:hypothetical protein
MTTHRRQLEHAGSVVAASDLLPLDELAQRLRLSPKTVKRLGKYSGLPLFRVIPNGALYAFWPDVERWIRRRAIKIGDPVK